MLNVRRNNSLDIFIFYVVVGNISPKYIQCKSSPVQIVYNMIKSCICDNIIYYIGIFHIPGDIWVTFYTHISGEVFRHC